MIELLNIDCMEYMKTCKDKQFDLAICDPPYGINFANRGDGSGNLTKHKWKNHVRKQWDKNSPDQNYFNEVFRISKNQIVWGLTT